MNRPGIPGGPLGDAAAAGALFAAWCGDGGDGPTAAAGLATAGAAQPAPGAAPWFAAEGAAAWAAELADDVADAADRALLERNIGALRRGEADLVVTGQQPGFLGGPLLTLHKIATAVALARRLSTPARPVVPLFWSGDDDDDLVEALGPVAWSPGAGLVRSEAAGAARRGALGRRRVGTLPVATGQTNGLAWLAGLPAAQDGPARLWPEAAAAGWSWARLQRRALLRAFAGTGLLLLSGDDPRLHRAAGPFYARIAAGLGDLAAAARQRGEALEAAGWHAQIGERSLARPLFRVAGDGRAPHAGPSLPADPGTLRPGVMLRSPLQDRLLRPRAVVVGPGEHAYLRQLTGVYAALDVVRAPLVPRLFAWLLPAGFERELLTAFRSGAGPGAASLQGATDRWQQESERLLRRLLAGEAGLPEERARSLAADRMRRWRRGVDAVLRGALADQRQAGRPRRPAWVFPDGQRQERRLAWAAALALWGPRLVGRLVAAADGHLDHGARGDWREWEIEVTAPEETA